MSAPEVRRGLTKARLTGHVPKVGRERRLRIRQTRGEMAALCLLLNGALVGWAEHATMPGIWAH